MTTLEAGPSRHSQLHVDAESTSQAPELPKKTRCDVSDSNPNSPWARKMILAFDGGGIRGYCSLLVLKRLMFLIEQIELGQRPKRPLSDPSTESEDGHSTDYYNPNDESSAYPWTPKLFHMGKSAQIRITHEGPEDLRRSLDHTFRSTRSKFRPHHYFDYVAGTSTGGLSAIMLGRMQMTVDQALHQYDVVGERVFAKPRRMHSQVPLLSYARPKYPSKHMNQALQEVTKEGLAEEMQELKLNERKMPFANKDKSKCRTVVVAHGPSTNGAIKHEYVFRSYDHLHPSPLSDPRWHNRHLNPGHAHRDPVWKIARATSAAPKYFSKISFGNRTFRDGGIVANNPAKLILDEVSQMHSQRPQLLLSIGTGAPEEDDRAIDSRQVSYLADWGNVVKILRNLATQSEETHRAIEDRLRDMRGTGQDIVYHRYNVPGGMRRILLDQWEPRKNTDQFQIGDQTKTEIMNLTKEYLADLDVHERLLECARLLVSVRRRRAETERWEEYAHNVVYNCVAKACKESTWSRTFPTRNALRKHGIDEHSYLWKVKIKDNPEMGYACVWDQCADDAINVFSDDESLREHLSTAHKITDAQFKTRAELELWLDEGRMSRKEALEHRLSELAAKRLPDIRSNGSFPSSIVPIADNGRTVTELRSPVKLRKPWKIKKSRTGKQPETQEASNGYPIGPSLAA